MSILLVHDVLDAQIVDRNGVKLGRVDSVVIARDGDGWILAAVELGPVPLARRLHPSLGRRVSRWLARRHAVTARPWRIVFGDLRRDGQDLRVDVDVRDTPAWSSEALARRVIGRIPGA